MATRTIRELIVDNFAGGGGASKGIEMALGRAVDIAINHDPDAITMHRANHPDSAHYCEDVWTVDPREATGGRPVALCWFSPDCKHFSRAKGATPVNKTIRGLAWVALKWAALVKPRVIILENVPEFVTWGPVRKGRPVKKLAGRTFEQWKSQLEALGYQVEYRQLTACDYGAATSRTRFYLVARRDGRPIRWPEPTHGDPKRLEVHAGILKPWRTAADCIDWSIPCPSIFERKKPLAEATLRRIARGIMKYVVENPEPFIINYKFANGPEGIARPLSTITAVNSHYVVTPIITAIGQNGFAGGGRQYTVESPLTTIVSKAEHCLVSPTLIQMGYGEAPGQQPRTLDIEAPIGTIVAQGNKFALVSAFVSKYFGGGYQGAGSDAHAPLGTVTAIDHNALVTSHLIKLRGQEYGQSMARPMPTVTAGGMHYGEVRSFLIKYYGQGVGQRVDKPLDTITANDRFALVTIHGQLYAIADIGMRMLEPRELFRAQGFPEEYIIDRGSDGKPYPKKAQVARVGNSVCPPVAEALVKANLPECIAKVA
ncbi:MAG: DNA cytosine methyltransferase [Christensenellaceae bacterium]|nr:DNA cytosine methyltransferase [Christensenellaceae bacterium]MEA5067143.1 DNA cytosine methyltransferase [Eubacteriales bacterium]MEA5070269.1 DNA cytosine methyltransferase [Christensenellaceae bacterium]